MTIAFMLNIDDWVALSMEYLEISPEGQRARTRGRINGCFFFLILAAVVALFTVSLLPLLLGILAATGWYIFWPNLLRSSQRATTAQRHRESHNPCLNGLHYLEVTPAGLHTRCDVSDALIQWSGVARIDANATYGFVFLRNNTGYVIPRQKIQVGDFGTFIATAQQHLRDNAHSLLVSEERG